MAVGTWTALTSGPPVGINNCLLLTDGTVLAMNGAGQCAKLTPDIHGSYINGTWTSLATMNSSRLFFASDVLTNGNVFVAGGEYGDPNHYDAELYNPLANTWTVIPGSPAPNFGYSDSPSEMLPNGNLLVSDSQSTYYFYNVASNEMIYGGGCGDMNEVCWVKLRNNSIFAIDNYGGSAEHFVPSTSQWVADASSTPSGAQGGDDTDYLLPNGQVFHVGSTTNTAFYTPGAAAASAGTLVNGPNLPMIGTNALYGGESPGAMLVTGNILLDLAPNGGGASGGAPCYFYEYSYTSQTFTAVGAPGGGSSFNTTPFVNSMLDLPDGSVLFVSGQNSGSLYIYQPTGTPLSAGQPVINSITENADGSYQLIGTGLNGLTEGAMYGDDEQMACNYPLVRMTNESSGNVYYARTYNWNNTTVQSTATVTTEFALPPNMPAGNYALVAVAVGNASLPVSFTYSPVIPDIPAGLAAAAIGSYAYLTWDVSSGATSYSVKRARSSGGPYSTVAALSGITSYTDPSLTNGITYYYEVSAANSAGSSANSSPVSVTSPIIVSMANQYGQASTYPFTPTWSVVTNGDLILGQSPTTAQGTFTNWPAVVGVRNVNSLTGGSNLTINSVPGQGGGNTTSTNYVTCGNDGSGACLIYTLSSSAFGCTVTNIIVYGGWQDNGRDQQAYMVYYSTASNPQNFIPLTTVNFNPPSVPGSTPSATRVTIAPTAAARVLATNVAAVEFIFTSPPSENGDCGYAQIAILGNPSPISIITTNQYGSAGEYPFTPSWSIVTNGDLILHQAPSTATGNFNNWPANVGTRKVGYLTDDGSLSINSVAGPSGNTPTTNYVTCGNDGSGATVIYTLSTSAYGCTITNITVYGGWQDNGRDQQAYNVYYSTPSAPTVFLPLAVVNFTPSGVPGSTPSATRVMIAPTTPGGVLVNGVAAVKFDFASPPSENGDCGYAEIVVAGFPIIQEVAPVFGPPQVSGGNLILTGTGGTPNGSYTWLFTTNLTPPIIWTTNSAGTLDGTGAFSNAFPINSLLPEGFFQLQLP